MAKMKMNSGYFWTNGVVSSRSKYLLMTRIPTAAARTMNATAFSVTTATLT
jgi:hypothetical protein